MAGKKHVASQKKKNRACTTESRFTSGVNGDRDDANVLKKGPWTPQEDTLLIKYVDINGERCWKNVQKMGLMRCGKSCRLRWTNHLRPDLKKGPFSSEEEKIVIELHQQVGNRWSKIAAKLPGRTDNEVKNFWNTKIKKRRMNNSPETIEENVLSTQQSEANETPSSGLPSMNSPKPFSPKDSILNSSNPSINPQNTFSLTNSNDNPSLEHGVKLPTNSTMHKDPMISFSNNSTDQINFMAEKRQKNMPYSVQNLSSTSMFNVLQNPLLNPFPGTHILEFATGSVYYNPNPFETNGSASVYKYKNSILDHGAWNESQSSKHAIKLKAQDQDHDPKNEEVTSILIEAKNDQVSNLNGSNYYYSGLSTMEVTPMKELVEDKMEATDDELLSLLDSFSFEESPPKLHLKSEVENIVPSYGHYYLDQKIAFPSFSKASTSTASGVNSPRSTSSELDECIDTDDWINEPESS